MTTCCRRHSRRASPGYPRSCGVVFRRARARRRWRDFANAAEPSCAAPIPNTTVHDQHRNLKERPTMTVRVEKSGPVWTVIHNRPDARNAMDPESADALTQAFLEFDADDIARVAVFYGEGGSFCAG